MFLRYEYTYTPFRSVTVIDSEFEESYPYIDAHGRTCNGGWMPIANIYRRRGLPVAQNMMRAFLHQEKKYGGIVGTASFWSKQWMIEDPDALQYKDEIEKYLVLV